MFLKIYLIGFAVCFLISLLIEHFYYGNGKAWTVSSKSIFEDFLISLLSWIGVVGALVFLAIEWYYGWTEKGYGEFLYDYEEELKAACEKEKEEEEK